MNFMFARHACPSVWPRVTPVAVLSMVLGFSRPSVGGDAPAAFDAIGEACQATGEACSLGIDPDIYQMPLFGEYVQSGADQICATRSWSPLPPEAFGMDFMRDFWRSMTPAQQASAEASAFVFITTHWGPPDAPATDLSEVATPRDFQDEVFRSLQRRTTRVEFEVPKTDFERLGWRATQLPVSIPPDPHPEVPVKLRGWYIRGDGLMAEPRAHHFKISDRPAAEQHPLIVMSSGFPYTMAYDRLAGGIDVGRQMRKSITYFVARGYDVLMFDKRGHGYSEGLVDGMGEDVFRVLDLLEKGVIVEDGGRYALSAITPGGRSLRGRAAAALELLGRGYLAKTKPVILRGFSYGSSQLQKAMAMNYSDLPVEYRFERDASGSVVVDTARMPAGSRGYDFRAMVAISGFQGSIKYETVPYFLALDAGAATTGHSGASLKSSVYQSMDRWPAYLGLFATNDFETADGAIDAHNDRLRGLKDIAMVTGYHFGLASEEVDTYFAERTADFAHQALFDALPIDNRAQASYAQRVCEAERVDMDPLTQSILRVPSRAIRMANRRVDRVLEDWTRLELADVAP